jgi:predicted XRE-type DNA-binding protein
MQTMEKKTRERLTAAGFRVCDAEDFLGLSEEERQLVELRLQVGHAVRRRRQERSLSQKQLAARLKSSQSRVAKIEAAAADVSLDLSFRALFAAGGSLTDLRASSRRKNGRASTRRADETPAPSR